MQRYDEITDSLTYLVADAIEDDAEIALTLDDLYRVNDVITSLVKEFTE